MKRALPISFLLGAALLLSGCEEGLLTHFPHRQHLAELKCGAPGQPACLSCLSCHQTNAVKHDQWAPPTQERCQGCHDDAKEKFVHSIRPAVAAVPAGKHIVFSHERHLAKEELKSQCVKCHAGAVGTTGGAPLFPSMETCLNCHEHREQFDSNRCDVCHQNGDLRGLKPVSFMPHDAAWMKRHGLEARMAPGRCATCHSENTCDTCHDSSRPINVAIRSPEAIEGSFIHRFDFVSRHTLEARANPGSCATCHAKTECDACHTARGVSGTNGLVSPHPMGWASGVGSATNSHGPAARRDITSCAACHDQGAASNCVRCHKVGGTGGTPHPVGWKSTQPTTAPECLVCHGGVQ